MEPDSTTAMLLSHYRPNFRESTVTARKHNDKKWDYFTVVESVA
jgi:hypothetical protein